MELREYLAGADFSSYERAAILFLSTVECATARQVVSRARIPLGRIYDVLTGLVEKGIVQRRAGSPQQFAIPDATAALTNHLRKQHRELKERELLLSTVVVPTRTFEPSKPTSGVVLYSGRSQHILATIALRDAARATLDEYAPQFAGGYASQRSVAEACARGVRMRILVRAHTAGNDSAIASALAAGALRSSRGGSIGCQHQGN